MIDSLLSALRSSHLPGVNCPPKVNLPGIKAIDGCECHACRDQRIGKCLPEYTRHVSRPTFIGVPIGCGGLGVPQEDCEKCYWDYCVQHPGYKQYVEYHGIAEDHRNDKPSQ